MAGAGRSQGPMSAAAAIVAVAALVIGVSWVNRDQAGQAAPTQTGSSTSAPVVSVRRGTGAPPTSSTAPKSRGPVTSPGAAGWPDGTPGFAAEKFTKVSHTQSYDDPTPLTWAMKTRFLVTNEYAKHHLDPLVAQGQKAKNSMTWKQMIKDRVTNSVTDVYATPVDTGDKGATVFHVSYRLERTTGRHEPHVADGPPSEVDMWLVKKHGTWLVDRVTQAAG